MTSTSTPPRNDPSSSPGHSPSPVTWLFAYGTLGPSPRSQAEPIELRDVEAWCPDQVRGRLFELRNYPILVDWNDPEAGWVAGYVRTTDANELETRLDPFEECDAGLFRRILARTRSGRWAWVYIYPHPIPDNAEGPHPSWSGLPAPNDTDVPTRISHRSGSS